MSEYAQVDRGLLASALNPGEPNVLQPLLDAGMLQPLAMGCVLMTTKRDSPSKEL